MSVVTFRPDLAQFLGAKAHEVRMSGSEFARFGEQEPWLASQVGIELGSLEARMILAGGAADRVVAISAESIRTGRPASYDQADLDQVSRLEAVLAQGNARIGHAVAILDQQGEGPSVMQGLGSIIGFATGAVGLIKMLL